MIDRQQYTPGPAGGAQVRKDGEKWTLILVRELRHSPEKVWQALTDPAQLREWAPFAVDQHRSPLHRDGCCRVAPLLRCSGSPAQWDPPRPHRWSRGDEVRWLATAARGVRKAVRRILNF